MIGIDPPRIDFGSKGYGNLVELADLQQRVAAGLGIPVGRLVFIIKSAHIYDPDLPTMREAVSADLHPSSTLKIKP